MENIDRLDEENRNARYLDEDVNPDCQVCDGIGFVEGKPCHECYDLLHRDKLRGV